MASSPDRLTERARRWPTDQRGSMLIGTVLAMLLLTVLALSLAMSGTLEGKVAINHYALVKGLHVADAGIDGVRRELTDYVNNSLPGGWTGSWSAVLGPPGNKGNLCNGGNSVAFDFRPTGGAPWILTGANRTLFIQNNNSDPAETGNPDPNCTDTDGIVTVIADGRLASATSAFGASKRVAVDLEWLPDASGAGGWDNAIQGGSGGAAQISGNAMVYGGVALNFTGGTAWNMGGTSGIRNNYQNGADAPSSEQLRATTRALLNPTLLALGDVSLNAGFRVQQGTVIFGGGATAGLAQGSTTGRKQTLDSAVANDFDPAGVSAIHADRTGPAGGTAPSVPLLSSVVGGGDTRTWEQMLNQDGLHITAADLTASCGGPCSGNVIDGYTGTPIPATSKQRFCVYSHMATPPPGPAGSTCNLRTTIANAVPSKFDLIVDQAPNPNTATLAVQGLIVFDNYGTGTGIRLGGINGGGPESLGTITYTGSATIFVDDALPTNCVGAAVCAGRLTIAADIVTPAASFPTAMNPPAYPPAAGTVNTIGFMADQIGIARGADDSGITASNLTITALFYAQSQIYMCKQTEVFGSLLSAAISLSCNVPKIAAIKTMSRFLPPGLIGASPGPPIGSAKVVRWRELPRP